MAKTIDISSKLTNERPMIKLAEDKVFEIDNSKNTILTMNQKMEEVDLNDLREVDKILEMLLGKKAVSEINKMNLPFTDYTTLFVGVLAGALGEDYDVVERRFRRAAEEN